MDRNLTSLQLRGLFEIYRAPGELSFNLGHSVVSQNDY